MFARSRVPAFMQVLGLYTRLGAPVKRTLRFSLIKRMSDLCFYHKTRYRLRSRKFIDQ